MKRDEKGGEDKDAECGGEESEVIDSQAVTYAQVAAHWGKDGQMQEAHPMANIRSSVSLYETSTNRQAP